MYLKKKKEYDFQQISTKIFRVIYGKIQLNGLEKLFNEILCKKRGHCI